MESNIAVRLSTNIGEVADALGRAADAARAVAERMGGVARVLRKAGPTRAEKRRWRRRVSRVGGADVDLDIGCLRWAKVENLERLARALRVPIPRIRDDYARAIVLARELAKAIEADRQRAKECGA